MNIEDYEGWSKFLVAVLAIFAEELLCFCQALGIL